MKHIYPILLTLLLCFKGTCQDQKYIDSLMSGLDSGLEDTVRINLLNRIASELFYVNQEQIYDIAQQALELSETSDYKTGIAEAYKNLGIYFRLKGVYELAIDYAYKSLDLMEQTNNISGIGRCYNLIGIIYYNLDNNEIGLEYFSKALEIAIQQNDRKWMSGNYNNQGLVYENIGEYGKALECYNKALEINIELNNKNWIATNYGNIGSLYQVMGNPKCLDYYFKRLQLKVELNDAAGISFSSYLIGKYYNAQNKFKDALPFLIDSYSINDSIGSLLQASRIAFELSRAFAGLKNYEEAYKYHVLYKQHDDSLNFEESTQKITRLEMQYNFKKEQSLKEMRYQKTKLLQFALGIFLVSMIITVILLISRQKAKANQQTLEQKKMHLENSLMQEELIFKDELLQDNIDYLVTKNNLISTISEKLIKEKPAFVKENHHLINEIILELQSGKDNDLWEEFELRFNQVQVDFYKNLNNTAPNLTLNDKKLCAFLRLNMSSREIAAITHQSISSIETARTRLRKKLQISNSDLTLPEYLSQF